jgi:hypothetical protein
MMPVIRTLAATAVLAVILVTGVSPANAAPSDERVVITTIPKVPGFPITLDDETLPTNELGTAQFQTRDRQNLTERVKVKNQKLELEGRKVRLEPSNKYLNAPEPTVASRLLVCRPARCAGRRRPDRTRPAEEQYGRAS